MHPFFALNRLSAYLDGDLPRKERLEVERVLSRHPELEAELLSVQSAVRLLNQVGPARAPRRLVPEVLQALEERRHSPFRGPGRTRNILLFLGMATVIATGLAVWMRKEPASAMVAELPPEDDFLTEPAGGPEGEPEPERDPTPAVATIAPAADSGGADEPTDAPPNAIDIDSLPPDPPAQPPPTASVTSIRPADDGSDLAPYVPSWDKEPVHHEEGSPSLLQVAVYRVYANRADVLQDLHELARANGTLLVDSLGQPLQIRALKGGDDFASAHLTLPSDSVESFLGQLARLGLAVEISPPDSGSDRQELLLEVMYKP